MEILSSLAFPLNINRTGIYEKFLLFYVLWYIEEDIFSVIKLKYAFILHQSTYIKR